MYNVNQKCKFGKGKFVGKRIGKEYAKSEAELVVGKNEFHLD